mgnify:CR=1 FL=1
MNRTNKGLNVKIVNYSNDSLQKLVNSMSFLYSIEGKNVMVIVNNRKFSELELYGVEEIMRAWVDSLRKYNIFSIMDNGKYIQQTNSIYAKHIYPISLPEIKLDDSLVNMSIDNIKNLKDLLYLYTEVESRKKKSVIYRLLSSRQREVVNLSK